MRASRNFPQYPARTTIRLGNLDYEPPDDYRWRGMTDVLVNQRHCFWCGVRVHVPAYGRCLPDDATREHLVPHVYGGGGARNLVIACRRCNNQRGADAHWQPHPNHRTKEADHVLGLLRDAYTRKTPRPHTRPPHTQGGHSQGGA